MKKLIGAIIGAVCLTACNLEAQPNVYAWGSVSNVPNDLTNAVQVSCGWNHALAIRSNGTVTGWGDNTYGEAVDPYGLTGVVQVSAGQYNSGAVLSDGTIAVWGLVASDVVFPDDLTNVVKLVCCETNEFFVLRNTGEADAFGDFTNLVLFNAEDIDGRKLGPTVGDSSLVVLFNDGTIWMNATYNTPTNGNYVPPYVATNPVIELATSGGVYRSATVVSNSLATTKAWCVQNPLAGQFYDAGGVTNGIIETCGGISAVYGLRHSGLVVKELGNPPWPTGCPLLQAISAGYQNGIGIIQ